MAWITSYTSVGGVLNGVDIGGEIGLNSITWSTPPDITSQNLYHCASTDAGLKEDGVGVLASLKDTSIFPAGQDVLLAAFDIIDSEYDSSQLMIWVRNLNSQGTFEWKIWRRDWTGQSYTDHNLTNIIVDGIGMYFYNQYLTTKDAKFLICQDRYSATNMMWIGFTWYNESWLGDKSYYASGFTCPISNFATLLGGDLPSEKKSPEYGKKAKTKGGYNRKSSRKGTFDDSSDKIEVSTKPYMGPFRTGFINGYVVNATQLAHFAEAIFPEPGAFTNDIPKMIYDLMTTLINNKRVDYILDLLIVPVTPDSLSERTINCGGQPLWYNDNEQQYHTVKGNPIEDCFVDFNCGSITVPEYWANFLDFSGTRVKLFLPYVGYVDIQPEYVNGGTLKVWYRFNVFDGSFMCFVESTSGHSELTESLIAQYAGVAAVHMPIQAQDYSNKISGLISSMGALAAAGLSGGASAGAGAASSLANTMISKPGSTSSNGYNASSSFLSHRKPYLIIERQSSQFSEKYPEERGLPLFMEMKIGDCHGLTVCDNPHLDTITATAEEKERIFKYLTDGIIV